MNRRYLRNPLGGLLRGRLRSLVLRFVATPLHYASSPPAGDSSLWADHIIDSRRHSSKLGQIPISVHMLNLQYSK